jgi:ABC-2 type transport system permease protein
MYQVAFELLAFIAFVRYGSTRRPLWLYVGAAALGCMFTNMETFFLYLAIFVPLLALVFFWRMWRPGIAILAALGLAIVARIRQMQTVMGLMQVLLLPLSFLSGALYPLSNLPTWLSIVVRLNPLTYAVHPIRSAVFGHLSMPSEVRARLNPPITWGGWIVPTAVQLLLVAAIGVVLMAVAVRQFQKVE